MATFSLTDFLKEARRRRVFRLVALYIVGAWVALQAADLAFPGLSIAESAIRYVWMGAILGLPIALFLGWRYDIIGGRIVRTAVSDVDVDPSIGRADYAILAALLVVVAVTAFGLIGEISKTRITEPARFSVTDIDPRSIAVLPFVNMSDDASNEYFADGLSEELLNLLAKIPELRVAARTSSFSFKDQNLEIPVIAARLNVAHVLEGSVRKAGNQIRITAQLVKADDGFHVWSKTYDRKLENIFAVQDEIAAAVVDALKITLLGEAPKATETNPEAYALYLQGRYFYNQGTAESNKQAETLLMQALDIDPSFAPAWTELASVYWMQAGNFGYRPTEEDIELAHHAIQQALDIESEYGRAYAILARIEMFYDWDFAAASRHLQHALALDSGDAAILYSVARLSDILGDIDEAIYLMQQSIARDPVSPVGHFSLGRLYYRAHRLEEAADSFQMALSLSPGRVAVQLYIGLVLQAQGDAPAALVAIEKESSEVLRLFGTAIFQYALGDAAASDAALEELIDKYAAVAAYQIAYVHAMRGEIDNAFDWLEQAYDNRDGGLPSMLLEPQLANLHDDPRWPVFLVDKMGLPH